MFFEGRIGGLRLSKDGRRILAISAKGDVAVARLDKNRDVAGGAVIWPSFNPMLGEFSPDGRFVALVGMAPALRADRSKDEDTLEDYLASFDTPYDLCVEVYDLLDLKQRPVLREQAIFKTTQRPLGLAFTADRRELIYSTIGADVVTLSVFEKFGNGYRSNIRAKSSEGALVAASQIACGPGGRVVLDRSVMLQLRDASGQRLHRSLELPIPDGSIISHAWSPHGDILALSWLSEGKPFVRLVSMTELDPFQRPKVIAEIVTGVDIPVLAFSSAGNQLIACGADRSVSLYMGDE
jgi:WD40 repeat protein